MPSAPLSRIAKASIGLPLFTIQTLILIEGAHIFQIIFGVTCGDAEDHMLAIHLEIQRVTTTLSDNAAGE